MNALPTSNLALALALVASGGAGIASSIGHVTPERAAEPEVREAPAVRETPEAREAVASPGDAAASGVVAGTVALELAAEADPPMLSPYARRRYRPPTPSPATPGSAENVVVYVLVDAVSTASPAADTSVSIAQRDRTIIPHVTAVPAGTRIEFPNRDEVYHNLFSLSDTHPFNLGRYPPGESRSEVFPEPGVVRMFCDIHSEMGGVILVVETRWLARPDGQGRYRIEGVPTGRHRVVAWHETAGADTTEVVVPEGGTVRVDFRLPR